MAASRLVQHKVDKRSGRQRPRMMELEVSMLEPRIANGWNWQVGTWLVPYQQDRAPVRLEERTSSTAGGAENRPKPRKWPFDGLEARGIKGSEERIRPGRHVSATAGLAGPGRKRKQHGFGSVYLPGCLMA